MAGFTRPSKREVKREEYIERVERKVGIEIYYILLIIILKPAAWRKCNATAAGRGNDDEDEGGDVDGDEVDVVIIMVR